MEELPVYVPHPKICHTAQYHGCKNHRSCRLYPRCSRIEYPNTVRCQVCPSCTCSGCIQPPHPVEKQRPRPVATVSEDGTVKAVKAGTATITAACDSITATCTVTVN